MAVEEGCSEESISTWSAMKRELGAEPAHRVFRAREARRVRVGIKAKVWRDQLRAFSVVKSAPEFARFVRRQLTCVEMKHCNGPTSTKMPIWTRGGER